MNCYPGQDLKCHQIYGTDILFSILSMHYNLEGEKKSDLSADIHHQNNGKVLMYGLFFPSTLMQDMCLNKNQCLVGEKLLKHSTT